MKLNKRVYYTPMVRKYEKSRTFNFTLEEFCIGNADNDYMMDCLAHAIANFGKKVSVDEGSGDEYEIEVVVVRL